MSRTFDGLQAELPLVSAPPPATLPTGVTAEIAALFEKLALAIKAQGFEHYSARAILHRIRWHFHVERGDKDFKCNNNITPALARWFMARHPELPDFFETRVSPQKED